MQVTRTTFRAAIEAGIDADRMQEGFGHDFKDNRQLTEDEIAALRDLGKTAETVSFRGFNNCPVTQVGIAPEGEVDWPDIPWCFIYAFDAYIESRVEHYSGEVEIID